MPRFKTLTNINKLKSISPIISATGTKYSAGQTVTTKSIDGQYIFKKVERSGGIEKETTYIYTTDNVYMAIGRIIKNSGELSSVKYAELIDDKNTVVQTIIKDSESESDTDGEEDGSSFKDLTDFDQILDDNFTDWDELNTRNAQYLDMKSTVGIFGLPYQYMQHVDPRIIAGDQPEGKQYNVGSVYANNIISGMPLLLITPGKPAFMAGYKTDKKKSMIQKMIDYTTSGTVSGLDDLVSDMERFYTFEYDLKGYYEVVNPMCRITARFMNIQDKKINDTKLDNLNWMTLTGQKIQSFLSFNNDLMSIPFYLDSETQVSDSISNSLADISLASTVDQFSDMAKELMFYMGFVPSVAGFDSAVNADLLTNQQNFSNFVEGLNLGGSIFGTLGKQIASVATGGKLIFPKIWGGSDFSRSYNVQIKLRSPDLDNFSLWVNIIVPLCHILGLCMPRMVTDNPNAYTTPPLVRCMYKGFFNVDMGMITSADVSKGDDAQWSAEGIPTSVDVNLTITDLYDAMSLTATKATNFSFDTVANTAEMDYLMNLCGINIYKPEIGRLLDVYLTNRFGNKLPDLVTNLWGSIKQGLSQSINNIFRGYR